jgi:hypothetical protein
MESFNLKKLNRVMDKEKYCIEDRFTALEYLDTEIEINSAWQTIRENFS